MTKAELIKKLGISARLFYLHAKSEDAPKENDFDQWREFLSTRVKRPIGSDRISADELNQLKAKLLRERAGREEIERKLKEIKLEREEKGFVPFEEAKQAITRVLEPLSRVLDGVPKKYALRVNPSDPDHAEEMLREVVEEIKRQVQDERGEKISKRKGVK